MYYFQSVPVQQDTQPLIQESNSHQVTNSDVHTQLALIPDISPPSNLYVDRIVSHISLRTKTETSKFETIYVI